MTNSSIIYRPFNVLQVDLEGSNLVQASAGTGKTYSISVLVLRMIMQKSIPINEILMVTFTNAAVAELEERVRHFILETYRYIKGSPTDTKEIKEIIDTLRDSTDEDVILKRIKDTLLLLDEIQIYTINSFCQNVLTEYAFETGQLFSSQLVADQNPYLVRFANEYWREEITTLPYHLLETISAPNLDILNIYDDNYDVFTKDTIDQIIINGKIEINHFIHKADLDLEKASDDLKNQVNTYHSLIKKAHATYQYYEDEIISSIKQKSFRAKLNAEHLQIDHKFALIFNTRYKNGPPQYILNISEHITEHIEQVFHAKKRLHENIRNIQKYLIGHGITYVLEKLSQYKQDNNLMSFNDSILFLYRALQNPITVKKINHPYKALFVDEFQDTDMMQYEIFKTLFANKSIQFYIGDPKQSIYGFRGADLDTYKAATVEMDHHYTMTTNYRSTDLLISAVNELYKHVDNPFLDNAIQYEQVDGKKDHELLQSGEFISSPIAIISYGNKDSLIFDVTKEIEAILTDGHFIQKGKEKRNILPEDIAVLTRDKATGQKIKIQLSKMNIPAVQMAESNIFKSDEATWVSFIFQAILRPTAGNVNRAIFHPATGITQRKLKEVNTEYWIEEFNELRKTLFKFGVYPSLMEFLSVFDIRSSIQKSQIEGGDRIVANFHQLAELLHEVEKYKLFQGEELLQWLIQQQTMEEIVLQNDIKAERIESDGNAVQITTIHKSKGLTYNIVFFADISTDIKKRIDKIYEYKGTESNIRYSVKYPDPHELELHKEQNTKEAYRLLYVVITRAVYKIIVFTKEKSAFNTYFNALPDDLKIKWVTEIDHEQKNKAFILEENNPLFPPKAFNQNLYDNWGVMSYSSIASHNGIYERDDLTIINNDFEDFVFNLWGKGAVHGNFIHDTLEEIDFASDEKWAKVIKKQSTLYPTIYNEDHVDFYHQFISHIVNTSLNSEGLKLKDVNFESRISEMEFYYDLGDVQLNKMKSLISDIDIEKNIKTKGIMYGLVDLFFEYQGKYYILDWKSNYLGNHLNAYTSDKLYDAMTINNYHLQYWVYTIAMKRYLEQNKPSFDYGRDFGGVYYLFVRGIREGNDTGVFFTKPSLSILEQIDEINI